MIYNDMFGISWATAQYFLYLLPLIIVACLLLVRRAWWQKKTAQLLGASPNKLLRHFSLFRKVLKTVLLILALFCLVLALARPQWGEAPQAVAQEGRDVLIALDISRSMLAQDIKPSRLEAAKAKIKELVSRFGAERVCLMVFSSVPFIQCPFTTDIGAFTTFLDFVDAESISSGTTALDAALEKAVDTFNEMPARKHKIMVIFTDGEDFSPPLTGMEEKIKNSGLSVFTVGIGTPEGAPIPLTDEQGKPVGHLMDEKGSVVITRLNEPLLKKLSAQTGARYLRATQDESDIERLVGDVRHFEKEKFEDRMFSTKQEKYFIFAVISFLALLVEWLL